MTMLIIDWAMRATCMASRTRPSDGTASKALYEGAGTFGIDTGRFPPGCVCVEVSVPQIGYRRPGRPRRPPVDQADLPHSGSTVAAGVPPYAWARADWL